MKATSLTKQKFIKMSIKPSKTKRLLTRRAGIDFLLETFLFIFIIKKTSPKILSNQLSKTQTK